MLLLLSPKVARIVQAEALSLSTLHRMLDNAAFTSLEGCNRRYEDWGFTVNGDLIVNMRKIQPVTIGKGQAKVYEDHDACEGAGCKACGWVGSICRFVTDKRY